MTTVKEIKDLDQIKEIIGKLLKEYLAKIYLFGSRVQGTAGTASDAFAKTVRSTGTEWKM